MTKVIDTKDVMERLHAYSKHGKIDVQLLCIDLVILLKWVGKDKRDLFSEINYQWDRVMMPGERAPKILKPGMPH